jgi:hypothetical protein
MPTDSALCMRFDSMTFFFFFSSFHFISFRPSGRGVSHRDGFDFGPSGSPTPDFLRWGVVPIRCHALSSTFGRPLRRFPS